MTNESNGLFKQTRSIPWCKKSTGKFFMCSCIVLYFSNLSQSFVYIFLPPKSTNHILFINVCFWVCATSQCSNPTTSPHSLRKWTTRRWLRLVEIQRSVATRWTQLKQTGKWQGQMIEAHFTRQQKSTKRLRGFVFLLSRHCIESVILASKL